MANAGEAALLEVVQGEDYVAQFVWSGDDGDPVPLGDPVELQVKDQVGTAVLDFKVGNDIATLESVVLFPSSPGFFQLTIPGSRTDDLIAGRYVFDMFAGVADESSPWAPRNQVVQVMTGYVDVKKRTTVLPPPDET